MALPFEGCLPSSRNINAHFVLRFFFFFSLSINFACVHSSSSAGSLILSLFSTFNTTPPHPPSFHIMDNESREIVRLWRVYRTIHQLCAHRVRNRFFLFVVDQKKRSTLHSPSPSIFRPPLPPQETTTGTTIKLPRRSLVANLHTSSHQLLYPLGLPDCSERVGPGP